MRQAPTVVSPPRRRRGLKLAILTIVALIAVVIGERMASWTCCKPLFVSEDAWIDLDRARRLWRASVGLAMPGAPDPATFDRRLADAGVKLGSPVLVRIFKREFELEIWMRRDGRFKRFQTYPICMWSGSLGPKFAEGDRQTPEGFYAVDKSALNPNSSYYRSFNIGYPNAFDAAKGRTGSLIMVHGACASVGCFAMTDVQMDEIWRLVTAALDRGQKRFQVQVYPFRMTEQNLARFDDHPAQPLWRALKVGHDMFEASFLPPRVAVCREAYSFRAGGPATIVDAAIVAGCPPDGAS